jgi:hypothetical protein
VKITVATVVTTGVMITVGMALATARTSCQIGTPTRLRRTGGAAGFL